MCPVHRNHTLDKLPITNQKTPLVRDSRNAHTHAADGSSVTSSTALMTCKAAAAQDASKLARSQLPLLSPSPAKEPMFRLWPGEGEVSAESGGHAQRGSARDGYSLNEPALGRVG